MYFYVIFALMLTMDLFWWRWADARLRPLPLAPLWRSLLTLFVGTLTVCILVFLVAPSSVRRAHGVLPVPLHAMVYLWHMGILPLTWIVIALSGGGRLAWRGVGRLTRTAGSPPRDEREPQSSYSPSFSRRQFLGATAAALPPLVAAGVVGYGVSRLDHFRINHKVVRLPGLPPDLDGLRIAHISDVHVGKFTFAGMLPRIAEAANRSPEGGRPHLTLLTGDLIDLSITDLPAAIDFLRRLDPLHGLAMCEGNHDLIDQPKRFYEDVRRAGIPLLIDEAKSVRIPGAAGTTTGATPIQLLGMRWSPPTGGRRGGGANQIPDAMARLLPQKRDDAFPILLAHHPHAFDPAAAAGIPLTLAGHTHGGQIQIGPIQPASLFYRYYSGLYRKGDSACFVSNGVGNWFPLRLGAPAEVVHLTLRRA